MFATVASPSDELFCVPFDQYKTHATRGGNRVRLSLASGEGVILPLKSAASGWFVHGLQLQASHRDPLLTIPELRARIRGNRTAA